ncbi:hypothetical protein MKZ38_008316 [Zalerion maritima]|uniref:Uncharacterized protein n=1 Tax=Zalerion maritima TaxID=339359 RepID=A0AAD5WNP3_9PEZI|nr:hypothetical protein MKZ38_008316 [Zalerion maritima]
MPHARPSALPTSSLELPKNPAPEEIIHVLCNSASCPAPRTPAPSRSLPSLHTHPIDIADTSLDNTKGPYHLILCDRDFATCPLLATPLPHVAASTDASSSSCSCLSSHPHAPSHPRPNPRHAHYIPTSYITSRATHRAWQSFHSLTPYVDSLVFELSHVCAAAMSCLWVSQMDQTFGTSTGTVAPSTAATAASIASRPATNFSRRSSSRPRCSSAHSSSSSSSSRSPSPPPSPSSSSSSSLPSSSRTRRNLSSTAAASLSPNQGQNRGQNMMAHTHPRQLWSRYSPRKWRSLRKRELFKKYRRDFSLVFGPAVWMNSWAYHMAGQLGQCQSHLRELRCLAGEWRRVEQKLRVNEGVKEPKKKKKKKNKNKNKNKKKLLEVVRTPGRRSRMARRDPLVPVPRDGDYITTLATASTGRPCPSQGNNKNCETHIGENEEPLPEGSNEETEDLEGDREKKEREEKEEEGVPEAEERLECIQVHERWAAMCGRQEATTTTTTAAAAAADLLDSGEGNDGEVDVHVEAVKSSSSDTGSTTSCSNSNRSASTCRLVLPVRGRADLSPWTG